jgi:hypothetical protein
MAIQHQVAGPVIVTFNAAQLGYSRDGVQIRVEPKWGDIFSDDFGGAGGAPADAQLLGAICTVIAELTKYEKAEVHKLSSFEKAGTAGVLPQLGTLIRQESEFAALLLDGKNEDWTFSTAFLRQAQEVNKGTRFSTFVIGFECWINNTTARTLFTIV